MGITVIKIIIIKYLQFLARFERPSSYFNVFLFLFNV